MADATAPYTIEALGSTHDRATFACGVAALDRYLATQATQDIRRRMAACFVAVPTGSTTIAGYYTIATSSIPLPEITATLAKKLPRYPLIPAVRIGRLAVDAGHRRKGLGAALLVDGIARAIRAEITAFAVVVDAKDACAVAFYTHHGFAACASAPTTLYLPLAEAAKHLGIAVKMMPSAQVG
jgi:GNAT superfamily N-acetyltransferase